MCLEEDWPAERAEPSEMERFILRLKHHWRDRLFWSVNASLCLAPILNAVNPSSPSAVIQSSMRQSLIRIER
jgi:hypothetical protein